MRKRIQASVQSSNQIKIVVRYFSRIAVLVTAALLFANPGFAVLGDYDGDCNVDQDDLLVDNALEKLADALRSKPGQDAVACWTEFFGEYNGVEAKPPFDEPPV